MRRCALRILSLTTVAAAAALALALTADGHPRGSQQRGFVSTVAAVEPNVLGLRASVLGGDDRLLVQNLSGKTVLISGYDGEPFLRFARGAVFRNVRSPTTYLSSDRSNDTDVPAIADASSSPVWKRVAAGESFAWHDRRIRWMEAALPASVRNEPNRSHHLRDWSVSGTAGGDRFAIVGFLGYAPPADGATPESRGAWALWGALAFGLAALASIGTLEWVRRRG